MEAWFLQQWRQNSLWQVLLRPLSWIFAALVRCRRALYRAGLLKRDRVGVAVIVVGNISVGGTGKTPVVLALAEILARSGWHCGIILRGYAREDARGNSREDARRYSREDARGGGRSNMRKQLAENFVIHVVSNSSDAAESGDEALMLARRLQMPVYVSANRVQAARALLRDHPEVDVLISDDGLQHYALERDLEICVIDGARGFGNGALLPAGPLREPIDRLGEVDAIVINGGVDETLLAPGADTKHVPVYRMHLGRESFHRLQDGKTLTIEQGMNEFSNRKIVAVAGTGNPERFFAHLASLGLHPATSRAFPDHHPFASADFAGVDAGVILMTEKDAVKCKTFNDERMWFMRVDAILPDAFGEFVVKRMSERKN